MNDQVYKADGGKLQPSLLIHGMPRALLAVSAVLSYGAQKYAPHSWKNVSRSRYFDAKYRHILDSLAFDEPSDSESGLLHAAHEVTNALFTLEQALAGLSDKQFRKLLKFKAPPQSHKELANAPRPV